MKLSSLKQIILVLVLINLVIPVCSASSNFFPPDSNKVDTVKLEKGFNLKSEVRYKARDSIRLEPKLQMVYLFGVAEVTYEGTQLKADYVEINMQKNEMLARGRVDSTGKMVEKVVFNDGETTLSAGEVRYNFKSKKGKTKDVFTQEGEGFIHMGEAKKQPDNEVHLRKGKYTTCNLEENPHYHFELSKAIVIPDDKIVTGPIYMKIRKVPTPLALPFGYFPNKKGESKGIIIPQPGESRSYGFFLLNGGYYLPLGKKVDMQFLGDIYSRGSWATRQITRYKVRYKYEGSTSLSYSVFKTGDKDFPDFSSSREFFVRWKHLQDAKSRPGSRFGADVNFGSMDNYQNNFNTDATNYLSNTFSSNISYTKSWIGKPYSLGLNVRHSQNRNTRTVNLTAPELTFNVARFFPFTRKNPVGSKKWYENIGMTYSNNFRNDITTHDSAFAEGNTGLLMQRMRNGMRHTGTVSSTFKIMRQKFTFNPAANFTERWYLQTINKTWTGTEVVTDTVKNFARAFESSFNASLTTKLFGMFASRKNDGPKLRHVLTPSINFTYRPDFSTQQNIQVDTSGTISTYSPFDIGIFGKPSAGESGILSFSLINNLELKHKSRKDTVSGFVKVPIIENFQISTGYDIFKDSLNLSNIQLSGRTTLYKNLGVVYSGTLDPYQYENGRITREYMFNKGGGLGRMTSTNLAFTLNFKGKQKTQAPQKKLGEEEQDEMDQIQNNQSAYVNFNIPWTVNIAYNLSLNRSFVGTLDTVMLVQSINLVGDVNITKKLKFGVNTNYDFVTKKLSYTELDLYYDLHCWEFKATVIPFGVRKSYSVSLNIKSSLLQDLKLQHRRSWVDI